MDGVCLRAATAAAIVDEKEKSLSARYATLMLPRHAKYPVNEEEEKGPQLPVPSYGALL